MRFFRLFLLSICLIFSSPLYASDDQVNINTANASQLSEILIGIGPSKAEAIIAYRESYGPFKSVDELLSVKGVGQSLLEKNRVKIVLK
ncbi:MAG: helix-hairpin-helix domain-containing protein [Spongiibacteraceae bacterium]